MIDHATIKRKTKKGSCTDRATTYFVPHAPQEGGDTEIEFGNGITMLAHAMANQINQGAQVPHALKSSSRVRNFTRMNPLEFYGSKVDEDPQEFIDEVYKC